MFGEVWNLNVDAGSQSRTQVCGAECQVAELWVMSECQFLLQRVDALDQH